VHRGRPVQVDPIKPILKPPGTKRLKLKYDKLLSNVAFNFNLRRYTVAQKEARETGCTARQGLTLVHFSAQLEPCLTHKNTLYTLNTPLTRATQPLRAPAIPYEGLKLS